MLAVVDVQATVVNHVLVVVKLDARETAEEAVAGQVANTLYFMN